MSTQSSTFQKLQEVLAELTGNEIEDIGLESHLEEDLGLILDDDYPRLINKIKQKFADEEMEFNAEEMTEHLREAGETVAQLVKIIDEERDLG